MRKSNSRGWIERAALQRMNGIFGQSKIIANLIETELHRRYVCFFFVPALLLLIFMGIFSLCSVLGMLRGHVPAITTIFQWSPISRMLIAFDRVLPKLVLLWACGGVCLSWIASTLHNKRLVREFQGLERHLSSFLRRWGAFLIIVVFLLALSRSWSSTAIRVNREDITPYSALFGLIPWSDAQAYYEGGIYLADTGKLNSWNQRRPLNVTILSFRLALSRFSPHGATLLQVLLLAVTSYLAIRVYGSYLGVWAAGGMLAFLLAYGRLFQATTLSETLGISFGNLSASLLYSGMQLPNVWLAAAGVFGLALGMGARAGALFMLPCVWLWVCVYFRGSRKAWLKTVGVATLSLALGVGWTFFLNSVYGTHENSAGANFAYTLCGLSTGMSWSEAEIHYAAELAQFSTEKEKANYLYRQAWHHIQERPEVFLQELWKGELLFWQHVRRYVHELLLAKTGLLEIVSGGIECIVLLGLAAYFTRATHKKEWGFWVACASGFFLSIPLIFSDGGWRVIATSWPFIAAFIVSGLASPFCRSICQRKELRATHTLALLLLFILAGSAFVGPWIAHKTFSRPQLEPLFQTTDSRTLVIPGQRQFPAIAVVDEGASSIAGVPTISIREYKQSLFANHAFEDRASLIAQIPPRPFLMLLGYDFIQKVAFHLIGPIALIEQDALFLKLHVRPWNNSAYFWQITDFQAWREEESASKNVL